MTQGNPYGNKGGRWMTRQKFRALVNAGLTYDEIADVNERSEGWHPSRSSVKYHLDTLGLEPRNLSHKNLIPWRVKPEHNGSELRHMLQAESRSRQGKELSDTDRKLTSQLHDHLFGRGRLMVVAYHPEVGFGLVPREDYDDDIIRQPRAPRFAEGADASRRHPVKGESASGARAGGSGDAGPRDPSSGTARRTRRASVKSRLPLAPKRRDGSGTARDAGKQRAAG